MVAVAWLAARLTLPKAGSPSTRRGFILRRDRETDKQNRDT
jgi:hypothetical protein